MFCLGSTQWVEVKVESLLQHFAEPEVVRFVGEDEGESEVWVVEISILNGFGS